MRLLLALLPLWAMLVLLLVSALPTTPPSDDIASDLDRLFGDLPYDKDTPDIPEVSLKTLDNMDSYSLTDDIDTTQRRTVAGGLYRAIAISDTGATARALFCSESETAPSWPALSDPDAVLYCYRDIWLHVVLWAISFCVAIYTLAGLLAYAVFRRKPWAILTPLVFMMSGLGAGFISGTPVGLVVGALYEAGRFGMNPVIAMNWGLLMALLMFLGSLSASTTTL